METPDQRPEAAGGTKQQLPGRLSTSSEGSESTGGEVGRGAGAWKGGQGQGHKRSPSGRARGGHGHHRRLYSYPGTAPPPSRTSSLPHTPYGPPGAYPAMGSYPTPAGVRLPNTFGSLDGSEYGTAAAAAYGGYPGMGHMPWMGGPWMGGYDWSGGYGCYMMNPLHACRSERSTRIVFVANVGASADDTAIQEAAAKFGAIRGYDPGHREACAGVFVSFFDVRHAEAAVKGLPEVLPALGPDEQNPCSCYFMMPPVGVAGMENQGTLAISDASSDISNAELKAVFAKHGDIRSVWETNPPAPEFRFVEFFDTRCAEAAVSELKGVVMKECNLRLEFAPFAGLEPVAPAAMPPYYLTPPPAKANGDATTAATAAAATESPYYAWPGYHGMPPQPPHHHHHHHHHSYSGDNYLTQRASAPEPTSDYAARPTDQAMWGPQGYMGYGGAYWPYGGQQMMQPMYNEMMGVRADGNTSPGRQSNGSESHNWRPHRTSRSSGDKNYDPSQFEFSLDEACGDKQTARTTLMIRNIPNKYSQKMLLDVLNRKYSSSYDFFYLPIDFKNRCNLGYAFVNFSSSTKTAEFYKEFHAKAWEEFNSKKVCEITYARVQGKEALVEHFRNSRFPCNDPDYLPLVFDTVEEGAETEATEDGKSDGSPQSKGTPVHHWANGQQYGNAQPIVAAH